MAVDKRVRSAVINRDTNETKIKLSLNLDGGALADVAGTEDNNTAEHASQSSKSQEISVDTGIGFLDHMLHALAKHGGWSLSLKTRGDLHIDDHHTAEDSCIALGQVSLTPANRYTNECLADHKPRLSSRPYIPRPALHDSGMPIAPWTKHCQEQ